MIQLPQLSTLLCVLVTITSSSIVKTPRSDEQNFELLILHNNDMHARFEQTSQLSGACTVADRVAGKCYGGFPRVAHVVKEARKAAASGEGPPVLYLNAGDTYTGTAWFTIYKWKVAAEFLNALQPDAVGLGNDEFGNDVSKLSPFLKDLNVPVLSSNVKIHEQEASDKIKKHIVTHINNVKIGIIGYLAIESSVLDSSGNIEYNDEIIVLREEVAKLQSEGVKIIIALGHSEFQKNIEIAKEVEGLDLIINGYTNSYFWNGSNAEVTPTPLNIVKLSNGKEVPIIQSYAYNKYLGKIVAVFDKEGEIIRLNVDPILLDTSIPQDVAATQVLEKYQKEMEPSFQNIGNTAVALDGDSCRIGECNLGNLVLDSVIYYYATRFKGERWTDASIAIINGGGLTTTIASSNRPAIVTRNDLLSAIPKSENLVIVNMTGAVLLEVLEHSVADYRLNDASGHFLQFSGIRIIYNFANEPGSRVVSALARCSNCYVPDFFEIEDMQYYNVILPLSIAKGSYGYSMLTELPRETLTFDAITCTTEFISLRSPVYPEVAGRITFLNTHAIPDSASTFTYNFTILCISLLIYVFL